MAKSNCPPPPLMYAVLKGHITWRTMFSVSFKQVEGSPFQCQFSLFQCWFEHISIPSCLTVWQQRKDAKLLATEFPLVYLDSKVYELVCCCIVAWIELVRGYFASFVWLGFPNNKTTFIEGKRSQLLLFRLCLGWITRILSQAESSRKRKGGSLNFPSFVLCL